MPNKAAVPATPSGSGGIDVRSIADLKTQLRGLFRAPRVPVMIWGPTGVGKTAATDQVTAELGVPILKFHLLWRDLVDLKGVPVPDFERRVTDWFRPICFPGPNDPQEGVLFLDEINTAPPAVQALAYQMVQEGRIGDYQLPPGWRRWAAGNNMGDRGVTYHMPDPLSTRMVHLDLRPGTDFFAGADDAGGWREWALRSNVHPLVIAYLTWGVRNNTLGDAPLAPFWELPKEPGSKGFPNPRTWGDLVSDVIYAFDENVEAAAPAICGAVGMTRGVEFLAFCEMRHHLPPAKEIIEGVDHPAPPADRPDFIMLTASSLVAEMRHLPANRLSVGIRNFMVYIKKFPSPEYQVMAVRDADRAGISLSVMRLEPEFKSWAEANADTILG